MMERYGIKRTEKWNDDYPRRLSSIWNPPSGLYYRGDMDALNRKRSIAVIGSRRVSGWGIEFAYRTGYELGSRGITVVNGLALGCDAYALRGAMAAGGTCAAVMPCGLEQVVPHSNIKLAEKMLANGGCLLSEYPERTPVRIYQYVERDRLQSGISDGVLVIEAECDSGTMHTVQYALKQGRKLACIDSRRVRYASGNRWLENQDSVRVIQEMSDLNDFIDDIRNETVYRQVTFDEIGVDDNHLWNTTVY